MRNWPDWYVKVGGAGVGGAGVTVGVPGAGVTDGGGTAVFVTVGGVVGTGVGKHPLSAVSRTRIKRNECLMTTR